MDRPDEDIDILLVEDNPGDAQLIEHHFQTGSSGFAPPSLTHVSTLETAIETLQERTFDLLVLDLGLPGSTGLATLDRYMQEVGDEVSPIPVVVLTGLNDDEMALQAVERGAQDYLVKDNLDGNLLRRTIRHALERHRKERELTILKQILARVLRHNLRNDLTAIRGRCGVIAEQGDGQLRDHAERAVALCDDLVDVAEQARAVESVVEHDAGPEHQSLMEAIDRVVAKLREQYPETTVTVAEQSDPEVWAHPDIDAALVHVLETAFSDASAGEVTLHVDADEEMARVTVRGNDLEVPRSDVDAIRAEEETALSHASDLSLWLAYLVVERSHGDLRFHESDDAAATVLLQRTG